MALWYKNLTNLVRMDKTMEINKIKELTYAWCSTTYKVIKFENIDIKELQSLSKKYELLHNYSKKNLFLNMQVYCSLNRHFLYGKKNTKYIDKILATINQLLNPQ